MLLTDDFCLDDWLDEHGVSYASLHAAVTHAEQLTGQHVQVIWLAYKQLRLWTDLGPIGVVGSEGPVGQPGACDSCCLSAENCDCQGPIGPCGGPTGSPGTSGPVGPVLSAIGFVSGRPMYVYYNNRSYFVYRLTASLGFACNTSTNMPPTANRYEDTVVMSPAAAKKLSSSY